MVEPVTMALIASSAVSAFGSILGGFGQASQMKAQAKAAALEAKYVNLQRAQKKAINLEAINDVAASVDLIRSGRNVNLNSATGRALRKDRRRRGLDNLNNDNLSFLQQISGLKTRQSNLRAGARVAPLMGILNASGDIATMASGFGQIGKSGAGEVDKIKQLGTSQLSF